MVIQRYWLDGASEGQMEAVKGDGLTPACSCMWYTARTRFYEHHLGYRAAGALTFVQRPALLYMG